MLPKKKEGQTFVAPDYSLQINGEIFDALRIQQYDDTFGCKNKHRLPRKERKEILKSRIPIKFRKHPYYKKQIKKIRRQIITLYNLKKSSFYYT